MALSQTARDQQQKTTNNCARLEKWGGGFEEY
jgi:hypothetical protein